MHIVPSRILCCNFTIFIYHIACLYMNIYIEMKHTHGASCLLGLREHFSQGSFQCWKVHYLSFELYHHLQGEKTMKSSKKYIQ